MAYTTKHYTADLHFGHALMLSETACARPFASVTEMDEALIRNWQAAVKADDIVYVVGDFAFGLHDESRIRGIIEPVSSMRLRTAASSSAFLGGSS